MKSIRVKFAIVYYRLCCFHKCEKM